MIYTLVIASPNGYIFREIDGLSLELAVETGDRWASSYNDTLWETPRYDSTLKAWKDSRGTRWMWLKER